MTRERVRSVRLDERTDAQLRALARLAGGSVSLALRRAVQSEATLRAGELQTLTAKGEHFAETQQTN